MSWPDFVTIMDLLERIITRAIRIVKRCLVHNKPYCALFLIALKIKLDLNHRIIK